MSEQDILIKERKRWIFFGLPFTFTTYTLDERRLIINSGLLTSVEDETLLYRVVDITLKRSLIQKLFRLGTLIVYAQDKTSSVLEIKNIKNSSQFKRLLADQVENEKLRLRMRKGEIISDNFDDGFHDDSYDDSYDSF